MIVAHYFTENQERLGFELRITTLGYVQRGGVPGAFDRILATRLGAASTDYLAQGKHGIIVGLAYGQVTATPLAEVVANKKTLDLDLLKLARVLAK